MYLEHFGLREFPFSLAPDPRFLYLSAQHREALAHLLYGVRSEGGFVQLTGEIGTGKTTVCRCFLEQLPEETRAAVIVNPGLGAEELLVAICDEFGIVRPEGPASVKDSLDLINAFLLSVHAAGERAVLVIDEAQSLDAAVLEQLRLLTNLETSRHKLLQIILMGQPELRVTLARPELRQLAQRITARFHLRPLSREETGAYVRHRLEVAGCHEELFPKREIGPLRRLSRGVPRLINILCDRALLGAFAQGRHQVDHVTIVRAAREVSGEHAGATVTLRRAVAAGVAAAAAAVALALFVTPARGPRPPISTPRATEASSPQTQPVSAPPVGPAISTTTAPVSPVAAPVRVPPATTPAAVKTAPASGNSDTRGRSRPLLPVSGVLRALLEQPEAQNEQEAWRWLYRIWGISARDGQGGCAQALVHGLDCFRGDGGLEKLRRLNRPAIVRVPDSRGDPRWLVLERLQDRQVTFAAGGARTVVDSAKLEGYGITEFALLWKPPAQTRGSLAAGDRSPGVLWLARRLGAERSGSDAVFDDPLVERVRGFQRARGLVVDGIAGPETLILLDADPAPGTPTLAGPS